MADSPKCYTYLGGKKVDLIKQPDQFVVRTLPQDLTQLGIKDAQQMSSQSSRVTCRSSDLEPLMNKARYLAPTHHSYHIVDTNEEFLITDRIFVTFRNTTTQEEIDAFIAKYVLIPKERYSNHEFLFQLTNQTKMNPVKLVVKLTENEPLIEIAEHDLNYRAIKQFDIPTDPAYFRQWHLHLRYQHPEFDPRSSSCCEQAWEILGGFGSKDVVIGLTDDGCKLDHPDFDSPMKFAGWGYFEEKRLVTDRDIDANPANMYQYGVNHGTSCAGVIAGEADAVLTVGAAPGCRLFPIKWESDGPSLFISASKLLTALDYLSDKIDVLSNSWNVVPTNFFLSTVTNRIAELAKTGGRRGKGIVFLWAAGNENCPIQHTSDIDVPYTDGWELQQNGTWAWEGVRVARSFTNSLIDIEGVMHIAGLASTSQRSHYSNYGTGISLCAPTNNLHTYSRIWVKGLGITTATNSMSGVTEHFGGTSSATPLVAGVAALTISANPDLSALEVISILKRTASKDLNFMGYPKTPPASFDPDTSWDVSPIPPFENGNFIDIASPEGSWSPWFGHGRVDAQAAVLEALQGQITPYETFQYVSHPEISIPDNNYRGAEDRIIVNDPGTIKNLKVSLDITHTWIGDLCIWLIGPDNTNILLHNRSGSSADNIKRTYDPHVLSTINIFRNKMMEGEWKLVIQDLAEHDTGVLNSWMLEIEREVPWNIFEDNIATRIPDNDPNGITRTLEIPSGPLINEIRISVDITHPWIGDLLVAIKPPFKDPIRLHERTGESADNLVRTWYSGDTIGLHDLVSYDPAGTWQLQVADLAARDVGKLNRWKIEIR